MPTTIPTTPAGSIFAGQDASGSPGPLPPQRRASTVVVEDGTEIYYEDWGAGQPVMFSHGWPLTADSWEAQMVFLAGSGYRCIAHDRRGHGRSSQPGTGNEMDTYADDLATLIETLDLQNAVLVGFSTGGGEVARYIGRHGTARVAKAALISAVPPLILHGDDDQIVPIGAAAHQSSRLVPHATLKVYSGAPHGLTDTHKEQLNTDLLDFLQS